MAIVFIVCLVFLILDLNEIRIHSTRDSTQAEQRINRGGLGNDFEGPGVLVLGLYQVTRTYYAAATVTSSRHRRPMVKIFGQDLLWMLSIAGDAQNA